MDAIRRLYEADPLPRPSPTLQLLFSAGDILAALLIIRILRIQRASETAVLAAAAAWLCNPFTLTISTRGSCDVVAALLLLTLLLLLLRDERRRSVLVAAAAYGLVVHLRIYPIIYAPALVLFLTARALAPSSSSVAPEGGRQKAGTPPARSLVPSPGVTSSPSRPSSAARIGVMSTRSRGPRRRLNARRRRRPEDPPTRRPPRSPSTSAPRRRRGRIPNSKRSKSAPSR